MKTLRNSPIARQRLGSGGKRSNTGSQKMLKHLRGLPGSHPPQETIRGGAGGAQGDRWLFGWRNSDLSSARCTSDHKNNHWATSRLYCSSPHRKLPAGEQTAALHEENCVHPSLPQPVRAPAHQGAHSFGTRDLKQLWYSP